MNHLAHAHLAAGAGDALLAASVLGDFVKGPVDDSQWPADLACGIRLHRRIDGYTDRHPLVAECREHFPRDWRRLAGPCLDICWDHFLARQWPQWHPQALPAFSARAGDILQAHAAHFPPRAHGFSRWLARERILDSYATRAGIEAAVDVLIHRLPDTAGLGQVTRQWLEKNDGWLETRFSLLYPDILTTAQQHLP